MNDNSDQHDDTDSELSEEDLSKVAGGTLRTASGIVIGIEDEEGSTIQKSSSTSGTSSPIRTSSGILIDFVDEG